MTHQELHDWIKSELGYPTFEVEVTDQQIDNAIRASIDEITTSYSVTKYLTLDLNRRSCLDLSEYGVHEVVEVYKVDVSCFSQDGQVPSPLDPFSYGSTGNAFMNSGLYPGFATMDYSMQRIGQTNIHRVVSSYARMYQEQFYQALADQLASRISQMMLPHLSWEYDNSTSRLYVSVGEPRTDVITIEYIPDTVVVEDFEPNSRYIGYLRDMSFARTLMTQARVVGKYNVSNSQVSMNYSEMRSEASEILERIRTELKATANNCYIIG